MQAPVILNLLFIASPVPVDIISEERVIYKIELSSFDLYLKMW
jgi:hypothetical protein